MKKKIIALVLVLSLVLTAGLLMTACDDDDNGRNISIAAVRTALEEAGFTITHTPSVAGSESLLAVRTAEGVTDEIWLWHFTGSMANSLANATYDSTGPAYITGSPLTMTIHRQGNWVWYGTAAAIAIFNTATAPAA